MAYDLDKDVQDSFEFILGGYTYEMRYPTTGEIEDIQQLKDDQEKADKLLDFISAKEAEAPTIKEALKTKNMKVMHKFNQMILSEMGVDQNASS